MLITVKQLPYSAVKRVCPSDIPRSRAVLWVSLSVHDGGLHYRLNGKSLLLNKAGTHNSLVEL